jgi:hypothetical protein
VIGPHRTTFCSGSDFFNFFHQCIFASEKTPGHQKAARRGGEKDEVSFQRIGLSGSMAWSAEYPFTESHVSNPTLQENDAKITG